MGIVRQFLQRLKNPIDSPGGIQIVDGKIITAEQPSTPEELDFTPYTTSKTSPILTLDALLQHKHLQPLKKGHIPIGISRKSGELVQSSWQRMTTGIIAGRRNHGKSNILKAMVLLALHARKQGLNCKIFLGDPHHNLPDALGTFFKPLLDQFDGAFLGMESLESGKHLELFRSLKEYVQQFQDKGFDDNAPWHFIFIDESDLFFQNKEHGKETYHLIRDLVNLRKGRTFILLSFADTTKAGSGNIGTSLVAAGTTVFCVNYDLTRARVILQGQDEARRALNLPLGFAVVKIPDEKRVTVCQMPYVTEADLQPFLTHPTPIRAPVTQSPAPEPASEPAHIVLQDGKIIKKEQITGWDKLFGGVFYTQAGFQMYAPKALISEEQITAELAELAAFNEEEPQEPQPETESQPPQPILTPSPPPTPPGYLATNDQADFDTFLTYLAPKLSKRTIAEYGQDLKTWHRLLNNNISTAQIEKVLAAFEYHRAIRMHTVLTVYGQFRLTQRDPLIAAAIATLTFAPEKPETTKAKKILSEKESEMYHHIAKRLCEEKKRTGIWIELLLLGVKPSQIEHVHILNKSTVQAAKKKIKIPDWLSKAFNAIPEAEWRLGRKTIHKEVSTYETTPTLLNSAAHPRSSLDKFSVL